MYQNINVSSDFQKEIDDLRHVSLRQNRLQTECCRAGLDIDFDRSPSYVSFLL
jgi:hypothetical protein